MIARFGRLVSAARLRISCRKVDWPAKMTIGRNVRVSVTDGGSLVSAENIGVADFVSIFVKRGRLSIGSAAHIGIGAVIACREAISIGDNALIAEYVTIRDQDHVYGEGLTSAAAGFRTAPIVIGDNVWIGAKATITRGVTIGPNSVIGANAVVTCDIPANVVAAGIPARVIREIDSTSHDAETCGGNRGRRD